MKPRIVTNAQIARHNTLFGSTRARRLVRGGTVLIVAALVVLPFYSASSSSLGTHKTAANPSTQRLVTEAGNASADRARSRLSKYLALPMPPPVESIATYDSTCTNPKVSFNLGETVCARIVGAPLGSAGRADRRLAWVSPYGSLAQGADITTDPQTGLYSIPLTATQTFTDSGGGTVVVDNRGTWTVYTLSAGDGSVRTSAEFTVHDPAKAFVDLSLNQAVGVVESQVGAGSGSVFELFVTNNGPDTAQDLVLSDTLSANATFSSVIETTGLGFNCDTPVGGVFACNLAAMPAGATAHLTLSYTVNGGTPVGATVTNTASISSSATPCAPDATCELQSNDNSSTATAEVPTPIGGQTCSLNCHENMSVVADATQGGNPGAFVNFGAASGSGNCGAITATFTGLPSGQPASGAFYPVGTTLVSVNSETGGGTCSFTVTVVQATPPTITCPPDQTVTAPLNGTSATVDPGTPTTTPSTGVTVIGRRSDDSICNNDNDPGCAAVPLTDPYPLGTTTIAWTVTDSNGLTGTCTQRITVNATDCGNDTTNPTITAPPPVTVGTGTDPFVSKFCTVALDDELGLPTATDNCTVSISTSGIPAHNAFPVGTTTVTYTATDGSGNHASATQLVNVFDNTPPIIVAPANANYTCLSQVPAANPSQAHGDDPGLPDGGPPSDNCGAPVVTVTETSSGLGSVANPRIITRTFTATDSSPLHNSSSAVQTITVSDGIAPAITSYPATPSVFANANCQVAVPNLTGSVVASDNCGGAVVITQSPAAGTMVGLGNTPITFFATDAVGNSSSVAATLTVNSPQLTAVGPANMWVGLKNSDDVGTKFDLLAEILRNNVVIASGTALGVSGGSSGFNNAIQDAITMAGSGGVTCGDTLSFRLSVRVAANSGHVSGTARLWYDDAAANSRFMATIGGASNTYYLRNGFVLATTVGSGPKQTIDVLVNRNQNGNPFKPFGTWTKTF